MKYLLNGVVVAAALALTAAFGCVQAQAQFFGPYPPGAFYLGPEGGWTSLTSQNPHVTIQGPSGYVVGNQVNRQINYNSGFNAGVRAGYMWGPWRFEGEYSYRNNDVSNNSGNVTGPNGSAFVASTGSTHSNAIMANVLYDFTFGWPITPHIGGGIGGINIDRSFGGTGTATGPSGNTVTFTTTTPSANRWEFGYQGIAGLRYFINPALALDVDYRYVGASGGGGSSSSSSANVNRIRAQTTCCFVTNVTIEWNNGVSRIPKKQSFSFHLPGRAFDGNHRAGRICEVVLSQVGHQRNCVRKAGSEKCNHLRVRG